MSPSNMIRVIVATCFVVFITLRPASLAYYAANVSLQLRQRPRTGKCAISASVGNARLGSCSKPPEAGRKANTNLARWDSLQSRFTNAFSEHCDGLQGGMAYISKRG